MVLAEWHAFAVVLGAALLFRWVCLKWPSTQDILEAVFVFVWVSFTLVRLHLYFIQETEAPLVVAYGSWVLSSAILASPVLLLQRFWRRAFGILVVSAAIILVQKDVLFFNKAGLLWDSPHLWRLFDRLPQVWIGVRALFGTFRADPLVWWLGQACVIGFVLPVPHKKTSGTGLRIPRSVQLGILAGAFAGTIIWMYWGYEHLYLKPIENNEVGCIHKWGIWNQHFFLLLQDILTTCERHSHAPMREDRLNQILDYKTRAQSRMTMKSPQFGGALHCNVIMIQAEFLPELLIGSKILGQDVTPFLSSLKSRSFHFSHIFSQATNWPDGQYIALTSLFPPLPDGSNILWKRSEPLIALPQILEENGYYTFSASSDDPWRANQLSMAQRYGFQESLSDKDMASPRPEEQIGNYLANEVFLERIIPELQRLPHPFFVHLRTLGDGRNLGPSFPLHLRYLNLGPLENTPLPTYLQMMRELDFAIEEFVKTIQESSLGNNTIIVIYGTDSNAPKNIELKAFLGFQEWEDASLFSLSKVPMYIFKARSSIHEDINKPGGQIDIAPTILSILGFKQPSSFLGHSLLGSSQRAVAFQDGRVYSSRFAFQPATNDVDEPKCFDILRSTTTSVASCDQIRDQAAQQLEKSDWIHRYNFASN